jgi:hypothetical protein
MRSKIVLFARVKQVEEQEAVELCVWAGNQVCGLIEVEISGMTVRIGRCADAKTVVVAVLRALHERHMIGPTSSVRVLVATKPADFRMEGEGLAALVHRTCNKNADDPGAKIVRATRHGGSPVNQRLKTTVTLATDEIIGQIAIYFRTMFRNALAIRLLSRTSRKNGFL